MPTCLAHPHSHISLATTTSHRLSNPLKMLLHPTLLLGLAATASAIDGYFHSSGECRGRYSLVCSNMNPSQCCGRGHSPFPGNDLFLSVGLYGIPSAWNIAPHGYYGWVGQGMSNSTCPSPLLAVSGLGSRGPIRSRTAPSTFQTGR